MAKVEFESSNSFANNNKKTIRNTAICLVVLVVVYFAGSFGYKAQGAFDNGESHHEFEASGGELQQGL
ncbi:hypothetical protein CLIB1423_22S00562 [[Candida] railenensis]|uniref:Uncharacterized protein n=1 Tax=[Candida] railenensis TaxID=45579 RepID=A0A9P0QV53_9ASCO|nr:hypothetical protein CLIB1423_22S00562 [[Candida] railenensis]